MDKQLFVTNLEAVKKRKILLIRIALSVLFIILVGNMWLSKTHPHDGVLSTFKTVSILGYMIVVFVCVTAMQRLTKRKGLHCPHCNRSLSGPQSHRVVDSETCIHCGNRIF
jgi:hypothetical protein